MFWLNDWSWLEGIVKLSPRRQAQIGLGAAIFLTIASMATIFARPLWEKPLAFAEPGTVAPQFKLYDSNGRSLSLADLRGQAAVIYFTSLHCPDCATYDSRIESLAKRYRNDGRVRFIAINIDPEADPLAVRVDAKIVGRSFPTLIDAKGEVATLYSVKSTPQVAVIDPQGTLRYRGPFDDNASETAVTQHYCADTLATLLANHELTFASR